MLAPSAYAGATASALATAGGAEHLLYQTEVVRAEHIRSARGHFPLRGRKRQMRKSTAFRQQFTNVADACSFAQSIVDTVREPVVVLDQELRVIAASRSFYSKFKVRPEETQGKPLFSLGDGQWDIPKLRMLLEKIIPQHGEMADYEVEHMFPDIGHRTMLLNARHVLYKEGASPTILLGIEDITGQRILEREKDDLLKQKDILLVELQHRVANSLQIIASIILLKARTVDSEETRRHLQDAHKRVLSVAAVQQHLHAPGVSGTIELAPYLTKLCEAISQSMIGDERPVSIKMVGKEGSATSRQAESLGLIVTELVMNALKHAYPDEKTEGRIIVGYEIAGTDWKLSVSDDGIGKPDGVFAQPKTGLGTGIVKALASQLDAKVVTLGEPNGTLVTVTHATFSNEARLSHALP
jgi:two-component sensor histidine kinase/PAS domain-containing protein